MMSTPAMTHAPRRSFGITRVLGKALGVVGSIAVTAFVAAGAMVYLLVAWGQHRRRGRAARV